MKMTRRTKLALVGLAVLALPTLGHAQNLLVYGGFETDNVVSFVTIVNPLTPGFWGVEYAARTGTTSGIIPYQGSWMLEMDDRGGIVSQAWQFVNLVAAGLGQGDTLEVEAWYNSDAPAADVGLRVIYYATADDWGNELSLDGRRMVLDDDTSTWQGLFYRSTIPVRATWVGFEVNFVVATIRTNSGFVDSASLVPEPATMIALGIGLAALAARRRRK